MSLNKDDVSDRYFIYFPSQFQIFTVKPKKGTDLWNEHLNNLSILFWLPNAE